MLQSSIHFLCYFQISRFHIIQHYLEEEVESHPDIERKDKADFFKTLCLCATDGTHENENFEAVSEYWEGMFDQMEDYEATRAGAAKKAQYESSQKVEETQPNRMPSSANPTANMKPS